VDEDGDGVCDLCGGMLGEGYGSQDANAVGGGNSYGDCDGDCDPIGDQMMMHGAGRGR